MAGRPGSASLREHAATADGRQAHRQAIETARDDGPHRDRSATAARPGSGRQPAARKACAIGAATRPPTPPPSTTHREREVVAEADEPRVGLRRGVGAELRGPGLARDRLPGDRGARYRCRSPPPRASRDGARRRRRARAGRAARPRRGGRAGSRTRVGACHCPAATVPATSAITTGLAVTRAWPIAAAARSVASPGVGNEPGRLASPRCNGVPKPNDVAAVARASSGSCCASPMNAVLHEMANARRNGSVGSVSPSKLRNARPLTVIVAGHVAGVSSVTPLRRSAVAVTTLNVEPGGYAPSSARSNSSVTGVLDDGAHGAVGRVAPRRAPPARWSRARLPPAAGCRGPGWCAPAPGACRGASAAACGPRPRRRPGRSAAVGVPASRRS